MNLNWLKKFASDLKDPKTEINSPKIEPLEKTEILFRGKRVSQMTKEEIEFAFRYSCDEIDRLRKQLLKTEIESIQLWKKRQR